MPCHICSRLLVHHLVDSSDWAFICLLQIGKNDALPQQLCQKCLKKLTKCYKFISKCQKSEQTLHNILNTNHTPTNAVTPVIKDEQVEATLTDSEYSENTTVVTDEKLSEEDNMETEPVDLESESELNPLENLVLEMSDSPTPSNQSQEALKPFCKLCRLFFSDLPKYFDHLKTIEHPKEHKLACPFCDLSTKSQFDLNIHVRTHTNEKPFCCPICPVKYTSNSGLSQHLLVHKGPRYTCSFCEKGFVRQSHLEEHLRTTGETSFTCGFCYETFERKCALRKHLEKLHASLENRYKCEHCGKQFQHRGLFVHHTYMHTGEKPYLCSVCGKGFTQKGTMNKHVRTVHEKDKPYKCRLCEKSFGTNYLRIKHEGIHEK